MRAIRSRTELRAADLAREGLQGKAGILLQKAQDLKVLVVHRICRKSRPEPKKWELLIQRSCGGPLELISE
jgi:hypothetical protein